jgi:hypothetical protein
MTAKDSSKDSTASDTSSAKSTSGSGSSKDFELRETTDPTRKDVYDKDGNHVAQVHQVGEGYDAYVNGLPVLTGAEDEKAALDAAANYIGH